MIGKFVKHELKSLVSAIGAVFCALLSLLSLNFIVGIVLGLVVIPIACLAGDLPGWVMWLEVIGLIAFFILKRYNKFRKKEEKKK